MIIFRIVQYKYVTFFKNHILCSILAEEFFQCGHSLPCCDLSTSLTTCLVLQLLFNEDFPICCSTLHAKKIANHIVYRPLFTT